MKKRSVSVRVHPAGAALLGAAFLFAPSESVLAAVLALGLHEAAHVAALLGCGARDIRLELTPFGGMMDARAYDRLSPGRKAICAAAGVLGSAAAALGCLRLAPGTAFGRACFAMNASLAALNCLPAWPLDGARALTAAAETVGQERGARRLLHAFSIALGAAMTGLALWGAWKGAFNPTLLAAGPYLWYAASQANVAERVRGMGRSASKLENAAVVPVSLLATQRTEPPRQLAGRMTGSRYEVLLSVDEKGRVRRLWTEDELLSRFFDPENIGPIQP